MSQTSYNYWKQVTLAPSRKNKKRGNKKNPTQKRPHGRRCRHSLQSTSWYRWGPDDTVKTNGACVCSLGVVHKHRALFKTQCWCRCWAKPPSQKHKFNRRLGSDRLSHRLALSAAFFFLLFFPHFGRIWSWRICLICSVRSQSRRLALHSALQVLT